MAKKPAQQFMTLAIENGVEHILDLRTGDQLRVLPAPLRAMRRLAEWSVNRERVEGVLRAASIPFARDDDGDTIATLYGEDVLVLINPERTLVRFVKVLEVKPSVPDEELNAALRQLNNGYDVVRFRCFIDGFVCADYMMSYANGLSPQQLVEMLQGFTSTAQQAFRSEEVAAMLDQPGLSGDSAL